MKYAPYYTNRIKKQLETLKRRGYDMALFKDVVSTLLSGEPLDVKYRDHKLVGDKHGYRECHILSDWLLIYKIDDGVLRLILSETGTHSDLL